MVIDDKSLLERAERGLTVSADFSTRTIYLVGEVMDEMALRFLIPFAIMDEQKGPIQIILCSGGGDESAGYAIYDAIRLAKNRVSISGYGAVQSIAALIFQAAETRLLSPHCRFMIHNGTVDLVPDTQADAVVAIGKETERNNNTYHRLLAKRSGQTIPRVREMCRDEEYFSAKEAVSFGFADGVIKGTKK